MASPKQSTLVYFDDPHKSTSLQFVLDASEPQHIQPVSSAHSVRHHSHLLASLVRPPSTSSHEDIASSFTTTNRTGHRKALRAYSSKMGHRAWWCSNAQFWNIAVILLWCFSLMSFTSTIYCLDSSNTIGM